MNIVLLFMLQLDKYACDMNWQVKEGNAYLVLLTVIFLKI